jgi:hypothetical protein
MGVNISLKPFVFGTNWTFLGHLGVPKSTIGALLGHLGVTPKYYSLKPFLDDQSHWLYNGMVGENG